MVEIEFDYNQQITVIQAELDELFQVVINKYLQKSLLDSKSIYFLANGEQMNPQQTLGNQMNKINKQNKKMKVLVQTFEGGNNNVKVFSQIEQIICPICHEPCRIKIENYQIKLSECINNHSKIMKIKDFPNSQRINISEIICEKCRIKNKGNCSNNEFYKCLTCNQNLCLLYRAKHDLNHNIKKIFIYIYRI